MSSCSDRGIYTTVQKAIDYNLLSPAKGNLSPKALNVNASPFSHLLSRLLKPH